MLQKALKNGIHCYSNARKGQQQRPRTQPRPKTPPPGLNPVETKIYDTKPTRPKACTGGGGFITEGGG